MCGVAGIIRLDGGEVEKWRLESMNKAMVHRGPDGEGYWSQGSVGLAHLRLAIIDLATGDQPMFNEDGSVVVIFNGEIYNFLDLRPTLQSLGHTFRTNSDTEVLVHAYEEWGSDMLARLNGMFAFAIYDSRKRKLLLARDRLGVKPLYYYKNKDLLVFASEMGGLIASGLIPREIDMEALELYLHYQHVPCPHSIYRNVKKLSPAEFAELKVPTGQLKVESYWDIATDVESDRSKGLEEWMEELEALMHDAVRIRLISDVPFGAFLSGGIDSGLTVAMMASKLSEPVRTFSIGLAGGEDELPYARTVAEKYCTQHEEFRVTPEGLTLIPRLCPHFGEPFADSSAIPTYYVSKMATSRVKMVLTGDGGDEMFAGYRHYSAIAQRAAFEITLPYVLNYVVESLSRRKQPPSSQKSSFPEPVPRWRILARQALGSVLGTVLRTAVLARNSLALTGRYIYYKTLPWYGRHDMAMSHFSLAERRALLGNGVPLSDRAYVVKRYPFPAADSVVSASQYCDVKFFLSNDILVKVDRMSMANSLEVRSPLLDYRIAELAFSMPTTIKLPEPLLDGSKGKFILKELASKHLGREYVYRPKEGFGIPVSRWLREDKADYMKDTLLSPSSSVYSYLNRDIIQSIVRSHLDGTGDYSTKLWNLLMFDGWLRYVHSASQ